MTILNIESDGLFPELIALTRVIHHSKKIDTSSLYSICMPPSLSGTVKDKKLRGTLTKWRNMDLFIEQDGVIEVNKVIIGRNKISTDYLVTLLPLYCRRLIFNEVNAIPLWSSEPSEKDSGLSADFVRGVSWLLAQDIYSFPTVWAKGVESLQSNQVVTGMKIFQNDTRWTGMRHWARYLGFATGNGASFKIDPTAAIRDELPFVFESDNELSSKDFLQKLSHSLPVIDFGKYRREVESKLDETKWRKPEELHLSMSLSFALQRLHMSKSIALEGKADAGSSYLLTKNEHRKWSGFESVRFLGDGL